MPIAVHKKTLLAHPKADEIRSHLYEKHAVMRRLDLLDDCVGYPWLVWDEESLSFDGWQRLNSATPNAEDIPVVSVETFLQRFVPHLAESVAKRKKRAKGKRHQEATVNKATITFCSGEQYTVKDFITVTASAESTVFIMEDNWKGTVNYRQAVTVPNDDVDGINVRGVKHQFILDMALTNMGVLIFSADGCEILSSELSINV